MQKVCWWLNVHDILVRTFFWGFCRLFRCVEPLSLSSDSATGLFTISFLSLSMRSGSATPFIAFCRFFSTFSGLALPLPPFRKLSYSDTLLKHRTFGKGRVTVGEYKAARGSNVSEHTSNLPASSSAAPPPVSASRPAAGRRLEQAGDGVSLLSDFGLFLSPSSIFETTADERTAKRGIVGKLLWKLNCHSASYSKTPNKSVTWYILVRGNVILHVFLFSTLVTLQ